MKLDPAEGLPQLYTALEPLRQTLGHHPYLGGSAPDYSDYCVYGSFAWAKAVSPLVLLKDDDPVQQWCARMGGLFGGLGKDMPTAY